MKSSNIYKEAAHLVQKYATRDPFEIIQAMPQTKFWPTERFGPDGLKGFATIQNRTRYVVVNTLLCPEEQRVVAAHELGHLILHEPHLKVHTLQDFNVYEATGKMEREANYFAADLLISDEEVLNEIRTEGSDFFSVARLLRIPAPFLAFKLYSLFERGESMHLPIEPDTRFLTSRG